MPTSVIVIGTIIGVAAVRAAVTGQGPFSGIMQSLGKLFYYLSSLMNSGKAGKEYVEEKTKEMARDEKEAKREIEIEKKQEIKREKQEAYEKKEAEVKKIIEERQDAMKQFIPSRWENMTTADKISASLELGRQMEKNMRLSDHYQIRYEEMDGQDFKIGDNKEIIINSDVLSSDSPTASLDVFGCITKTLAYARQNEILTGKTTPSERESALLPLVIYENENKPECITIPKLFFLGTKINPIENIMSSPFIKASENDSYERQCIAGLQAAERMPNMMYAINFSQFKSLIEAEGGQKPEVNDILKKMDKMSYFSMRDNMNKLYGCKNIESEIDKAMAINDSMEVNNPERYNKHVHYAVSMYQAQTYQEANGKTLEDKRDKIVEGIHGILPVVSEKQYNYDKGIYDYFGIEVKKIVPNEEYETLKKKPEQNTSKPQKPNAEKDGSEPKKDSPNPEPKKGKPEPKKEPNKGKPDEKDRNKGDKDQNKGKGNSRRNGNKNNNSKKDNEHKSNPKHKPNPNPESEEKPKDTPEEHDGREENNIPETPEKSNETEILEGKGEEVEKRGEEDEYEKTDKEFLEEQADKIVTSLEEGGGWNPFERNESDEYESINPEDYGEWDDNTPYFGPGSDSYDGYDDIEL